MGFDQRRTNKGFGRLKASRSIVLNLQYLLERSCAGSATKAELIQAQYQQLSRHATLFARQLALADAKEARRFQRQSSDEYQDDEDKSATDMPDLDDDDSALTNVSSDTSDMSIHSRTSSRKKALRRKDKLTSCKDTLASSHIRSLSPHRRFPGIDEQCTTRERQL